MSRLQVEMAHGGSFHHLNAHCGHDRDFGCSEDECSASLPHAHQKTGEGGAETEKAHTEIEPQEFPGATALAPAVANLQVARD